MMFFKKKQDDLFTLQADFEPEEVYDEKDQILFDEALANHPHSAQEPNRSFVGLVVAKKRFSLMILGVLLVFLIFVLKLGSLQIVHGEEYRLLAENNRTRIRVIPAQRGVVYDRNGVILAKNDPVFEVTTAKKQLPTDSDELEAILTDLATELDLDVHDLILSIQEAETANEQILLATNVQYDQAMIIYASLDRFSGIDVELRTQRTYITDSVPSLSHILGYTGIINEEEWETKKFENYRSFDHLGKQGIEKYYETELRGTFGAEILEVNALGQSERIMAKTNPVDGENLYLSIDSGLQSYIETVLEARMEGTVAEKASVIVMNPQNGEIYALISWPAYDSNSFIDGIDHQTYAELLEDENLPLFSRAVSGEFPSGSTIKPVFVTGALIDGIITTSTTFISTGGISVGVWFFPDWRAGGHGVTDLYHAIADSVNTFFYLIGGGNESFTGMGVERLMEHAAMFGFGDPTGIDLPGEADGFLPSKEWKESAKGEMWYIGDTYHVAIGQGDFLATPLQIARATAVFANNGYLVTPHLNTKDTSEYPQIVQEEVADIVADAMRQTVIYGSATSLQAVPVSVAGKTGTAQWSSTEANHSWFTGFAPYEDPEIVITVLIEEGADASLAVPVTKDILNWWFAPGGRSQSFGLEQS